jgi:hypothetical protein
MLIVDNYEHKICIILQIFKIILTQSLIFIIRHRCVQSPIFLWKTFIIVLFIDTLFTTN